MVVLAFTGMTAAVSTGVVYLAFEDLEPIREAGRGGRDGRKLGAGSRLKLTSRRMSSDLGS